MNGHPESAYALKLRSALVHHHDPPVVGKTPSPERYAFLPSISVSSVVVARACDSDGNIQCTSLIE